MNPGEVDWPVQLPTWRLDLARGHAAPFARLAQNTQNPLLCFEGQRRKPTSPRTRRACDGSFGVLPCATMKLCALVVTRRALGSPRGRSAPLAKSLRGNGLLSVHRGNPLGIWHDQPAPTVLH